MSLKKTILGFMVFLSFANSAAYAGPEDWTGTFTITRTDGNQYVVKHTPTYARFLFFTMGECLHLRKGSSINEVTTVEDVNLCRVANIDDFTKEVAKLGTIIDQVIEAGPSYSTE